MSTLRRALDLATFGVGISIFIDLIQQRAMTDELAARSRLLRQPTKGEVDRWLRAMDRAAATPNDAGPA